MAPSEETSFLVLISGPFLILSLIYLIFFWFAFLRFKNLHNHSKESYLGQAFYLMISVQCILRSIFSLYLIISSLSDPSTNIVIVTIIYIPDILFWMIFLLIFWNLWILFYKTHIQNFKKLPSFFLRSNSYQYLILLLFIETIVQFIIVLLFNLNKITIKGFVLEFAVNNLLVPLAIFISEFYLHIKFSGLPYKTLFEIRRKKKINRIILYWAFARTLHGILDIILASESTEIYYKYFDPNLKINNKEEYGKLILYILIIVGEKIITEVVPFLLVFDKEFVNMFFSFENGESLSLLQNKHDVEVIFENREINEDENEIIPENKLEQKIVSGNIFLDLKIEIEAIEFSREIPEKRRKNGLGTIKFAYFGIFLFLFIFLDDKKNKIAIRCCDLNVSSYVLDEIINELKVLVTIQNFMEGIEKIIGYSLDEDGKVLILYEAISIPSLYDCIYDKENANVNLSLFDKIEILLSISKKMQNLLEIKPNPLNHGHLNTNNIFVNPQNNFSIKITDFLLGGLKKYCAVMKGYVNKNAYSAPEILKQRGNIVTGAKESADVYSFGIIAWELFSEKIPFKNEEEEKRPKIPADLPPNLGDLIRCCWQNDEAKRPTFSQITSNLEDFLANFKMIK